MAGERRGEGTVEEHLAEAVAGTIASGTARVVVSLDSHMGDWPGEAAINDAPPFEGLVDFASDRCVLQAGDAQLVMDGGATYQRVEDGRWTRDNGDAGEWSSLHPRWALEVVQLAATDVRHEQDEDGTRFTIQLSVALAAPFTYAGIAADWNMTASVLTYRDGRIARIDISLNAEGDEGKSVIESRFELSDFGTPVDIHLPPSDRVVSQTAYLAEQGLPVDDGAG